MDVLICHIGRVSDAEVDLIFAPEHLSLIFFYLTATVRPGKQEVGQ